MENEWNFTAANDFDIFRWSSGTVETVEHLYSPRIFGASQNLACSCGRLLGEPLVGLICPQCHTTVVRDAIGDRFKRIGKIELATECDHPLKSFFQKQFVHKCKYFPIAPISFRTSSHGHANSLGKAYEELVIENMRLKGVLIQDPSPTASTCEGLEQILARIVGQPRSAHVEESLVGLMKDIANVLDPNFSVLCRCCVIALKIHLQF